MRIIHPNQVTQASHRFRRLLSQPEILEEVVVSIAEAIQASHEQMHPQISPSVKGLHTYGHAFTNLGYATERFGGRLVTVKGQQRIIFDQPTGVGLLHVALTKGMPSAGGFEVSTKGSATEQLIAVPQQALDLDLEDVPVDESAFFVHQSITSPEREGIRVIVYLAHPARLNDKKTFLYCDECIILGDRLLTPNRSITTEAPETPVIVTPQVSNVEE